MAKKSETSVKPSKTKTKTIKSRKTTIDADNAIDEGIALLEKVSNNLENKLSKMSKLIDEIHQLMKDKGINNPDALKEFIDTKNNLIRMKTLMTRHSKTLKMSDNPDRKLAALNEIARIGTKVKQHRRK